MYKIFFFLIATSCLFAIDVDEFKQNFQLGYLTTEQGHPKAEGLSDVMKEDLNKGLALLHEIDQGIIPGFDHFVENYLEEMQGHSGRIVLVGAGSSGRIAVDLAARSNPEKVLAIIAGGDRAFVRAREAFEDSVEHGKEAAHRHALSSDDMVILISSSGSASFNVGVGQYAHEVGAKCYYFYNSQKVPERTQHLFDAYGVRPVLVDIGPPAIRGSTRLQSGTVGLLCLGTLILNEDPTLVREALIQANKEIEGRFGEIKHLIEQEVAVLSHPDANFYRMRDENPQGYITFISDMDSLREIMMDTSETAPTFSTNTPRTIYEDHLKQAEFQAFWCQSANGWEEMLGRPVMEEDQKMCDALLVGTDGLSKRHLGPGNLVIAVYKKEKSAPLQALIDQIPNVQELSFASSSPLVETIALKQMLNMISNSTMILMNKVDGDYMIDMKASNHKLTDRCIRLTQQTFFRRNIPLTWSYEELFDLIGHIMEIKEHYESTRNEYTPSPMKIAVTMIQKGCSADEAIALLRLINEDLSILFE
ncbi:MAG: N-acetylmuramic acid 6-phosphate etherase [Chlamydiia bacterium]|nr:N-acetylmuramic acid 6-phosphate etherase [Chlamydiia bacterium]